MPHKKRESDGVELDDPKNANETGLEPGRSLKMEECPVRPCIENNMSCRAVRHLPSTTALVRASGGLMLTSDMCMTGLGNCANHQRRRDQMDVDLLLRGCLLAVIDSRAGLKAVYCVTTKQHVGLYIIAP